MSRETRRRRFAVPSGESACDLECLALVRGWGTAALRAYLKQEWTRYWTGWELGQAVMSRSRRISRVRWPTPGEFWRGIRLA